MNALAMGLSIGFVYLIVRAAVRGPRGGVLCRAAVCAHAATDSCGLRARRSNPRRRRRASLRSLRRSVSCGWEARSRCSGSCVGGSVRDPVSTRVAVDRAGGRVVIWQRAPQEFMRPRLWWAGLLFLALAAVHIGHMIAVRNEGWGTTQARDLSRATWSGNLRANGWFYLADPRFPSMYTGLLSSGLSGSSRRDGAPHDGLVLLSCSSGCAGVLRG